MPRFLPVYTYSREEAKRHGELETWRESHKENCKCARAIEDAIKASFNGSNLQADCAQKVIEQFGFNRINYVLSNTIREKSYDGRFSPTNKDWSKGTYVIKDQDNWAFTVESHPAVLDGFINQARKEWEALGLHDSSHCHSKDTDYTGKVLVINPTWLGDDYKQPEYQLFLARSGFGCSPTASGRKVYGEFLYDGEKTHLNRSDFLGVIKEEHLPGWAQEVLESLQEQNEKIPILEPSAQQLEQEEFPVELTM